MAQPVDFQSVRRLFVARQRSASTPMMGFASLYPSYGEPLGETLYGRP